MKRRDSKYFAGDIIKCVRVNNNFTQIDLAKNLNWSQGYVSKIESGKLIPDAFEWMALSELFNFPADSLRWGYIDTLKDVSLNSDVKENGFSLPKSYRQQKCLNIRFASPFLSANTAKDSRLFFKKNKIDPAFQSNLSHQINLNLLEQLIDENKNDKEFINKSAKNFSNHLSHGDLWAQYKTGSSKLNSLKKLSKNMNKYQIIWHFNFNSISDTSCEIVITPNAMLDDERVLNINSDLNKFMDQYWVKSLNEFTKSTISNANDIYNISTIKSLVNGDNSWRINVSIA